MPTRPSPITPHCFTQHRDRICLLPKGHRGPCALEPTPAQRARAAYRARLDRMTNYRRRPAQQPLSGRF